MFGRSTEETENTTTQQVTQETTATQSPVAARVATPVTPTSSPATRRDLRDTHSTRRYNEISDPNSTERRLTVGKGLSLSGEISACDTLIVEGKVDAKLSEGKMLEITETGQFRGTVEIENADIAGRYDGELTVSGRLTIRSTGRISGMISYGELEINAGGQVVGELQVYGEKKGATQQQGKGMNKSAAKFSSLLDDGSNDANRRVVVSA